MRAFKERCPGRTAVKASRSQPVAPHLAGGLPQQVSPPPSQMAAVIHPSSRKSTRAPSPPVSNVTPEGQDCAGNIPVQIFVPVGDQTHFKPSEELSPPPPPPPPPPPLPARPFSSQPANHRDFHFRTSVSDEQPLPLVCESPTQSLPGSSDSLNCPGNPRDCCCSPRVVERFRHSSFRSRLQIKISRILHNLKMFQYLFP